MLKLIKKSDPGPELTREIREWLEGEIRALNEKSKGSAGKKATELAEKYKGILADAEKIIGGKDYVSKTD